MKLNPAKRKPKTVQFRKQPMIPMWNLEPDRKEIVKYLTNKANEINKYYAGFSSNAELRSLP